ncbi:MAG: hypothetical protein LBT23_08965 [Synergistaceae bacterium]|jgi:hypothetical protein|nr:hypothetical protein [Synergistaceae bacterium]
MSKFTDFYKKVTTDKALATEFTAIMKAHNVKEGATFTDLDDATLMALEPLSKKAGFAFTLAEAKEYLSKKSGDEMSEDELEAVAGGKGTQTQTSCGVAGTTITMDFHL